MESFKATTQHGDWEGTVAADVADASAVEECLKKKGLNHPGGSLVAFSVTANEKRGGAPGSVMVRAFFHEGQDFDSITDELASIKGPISVREARVDLRPEEFFELFESFELILNWSDAGLDGRQFTVIP